MLIFGGKSAGSRQKQFNEFNLFLNADSFKGTGKTDEFGWRVLPGVKLRHLPHQNLFLPFPTQSSRHSPPENEFLHVNTLPGMCGPIRLETPKIVDPGFVAIATKSGSEKKARKNEPGFLMFYRARSVGMAVQERLPERSNKNPIPFSLWRSEDPFKAFEKIGGCQLVAPIKRAGKNCLDTCLRAFQAGRFNSGV